MDKLTHYRQIIKEILEDYHHLNEQSQSTTESCLVFEEKQDHYLLLLMGWQKDERIKSVMIHVRLKGKKIWIEEDWTEEGIASDLLHKGISREEIVLAFHPPGVRKYTEFAIA